MSTSAVAAREYINKEKMAATRVQALARGRAARQQVMELRLRQAEEHATKVQARVRSYSAARRVKKIKETMGLSGGISMERRKELAKAEVELQMREVEDMVKDEVDSYEEAMKAAEETITRARAASPDPQGAGADGGGLAGTAPGGGDELQDMLSALESFHAQRERLMEPPAYRPPPKMPG